MWTDDAIRDLLDHLLPALEASIDPVCVIDPKGFILYLDLGMKRLLELKGRDLRRKLVFCDLLKHSGCGPDCEILSVFKKQRAVRLDEMPVARGAKRLRAHLKAAPIRDDSGQTIAAVITVRDTSGEVLLQTKYHRVLEMMFEKDQKIQTLEERIDSLQATLRRSRGSAA